MADEPCEVVRRINRAWVEGRPEDMRGQLHPRCGDGRTGFLGPIGGPRRVHRGLPGVLRGGGQQEARCHEYCEKDDET